MAWGFLLLFIVALLIGLIAIGKVEQSTSWGLNQALDILGVMAGAWGVWAFTSKTPPNKE